MGFLSWLFRKNNWSPEKYNWYDFWDTAKSQRELNLIFKHRDRLKIKTFAYIIGKKYRSKFFVTNNYCEIIAGRHKIIVPVSRCSFRKKLFQYYEGQSFVDEYYITVVAQNVSKEDYQRYRDFKK